MITSSSDVMVPCYTVAMTNEKKQQIHSLLMQQAKRLEEEAKVLRTTAAYLIHPHGG